MSVKQNPNFVSFGFCESFKLGQSHSDREICHNIYMFYIAKGKREIRNKHKIDQKQKNNRRREMDML